VTNELLLFTPRLSYHQRIVDIVPPTFSGLIPADPIFFYKYQDEANSKYTASPKV
jgi:nuclear cap-binding protein subunit 1